MTPSAVKGRPIRVLAVMEGLSVTGPAKNLFEFARRAREAQPQPVDLSIVTYHRGGGSNAFIDSARAAGIAVDVIREERAFQRSILRDLAELVRGLQPDVIQTHNLKSHFLVRLLGLWRDRPWIAFHHGYVATDAKVHLYNQLDRWSLRKADRVVTVCGPFAQHLSGIGVRPERITVRHNMIQAYARPAESEVEELRNQLGIPPGTRILLCAGRLSREKGHLDLIDAIGMVKRNGAAGPFQLLIAGEGPERAGIEARCRERGVQEEVRLLGHQAKLAPFYALADGMVLPSHSEGSPNVLLEAMAAGVPSVATAVGGVPEIAEHDRNALVTPKGDVAALASAITRLLTDGDLRRKLAEAGPAVTARFTPEAYSQAILGLYGEVLAARERRSEG